MTTTVTTAAVSSRTTAYNDAFYARQVDGSLASAEIIVPMLIELIAPTSVADVGCGLGTWAYACAQYGQVADVLGIDGPHVRKDRLKIPESKFLAHDLSTAIKLDRSFELVICLEVAEHLSKPAGDVLIESLCDLGDVIYFSAAIPFQGGVEHVNEQWPSYWAAKLAQRGYRAIDAIRPRVWGNPSVRYWYAQNGIIFANSRAIDRAPRLRDCAIAEHLAMLDRVHPTQYLCYADPNRGSLRRACRLMSAAVRRRLGRPRA
jgi:SAM-dependent methyltransferase